MGIFAKQVGRLQRTRWSGVDLQVLVDELTAIFLTEEPVEVDSGLQVSNPNGIPPINVTTNYDTTNNPVPAISVNIGGIQVPKIPLPPGTEPLTNSRFFSTSTSTTSSF